MADLVCPECPEPIHTTGPGADYYIESGDNCYHIECYKEAADRAEANRNP